MKRVILDTNIYGELAIDKDLQKIMDRLDKNKLVIYGNKTIRSELRDTPKNKIFQERKLRIFMLNIYDNLIKSHELNISKKTSDLANEYYITYKNLNGGKGKEEMKNDLIIISCATLNNLDIVVSDDCHSLCSDKALQAYKIVNKIRKLNTPKFILYREFKRWFV